MALPALLALGLSVLPKIPEIWSDIATLFGKEPPKAIEEAKKLADDITSSLAKDEVPPETRVKLEQIFADKEIRLAQIALEQSRLEYGEMSDQKDLQKVEAQSEDPYVRRTRPMILRRLFYLTASYYIGSAAAALCLNPTTEVLNFIRELGYYIVMLFGAGFVGYTATRSIFDKAGLTLPFLRSKK